MSQLNILLVEDCKVAQKMGRYILESMDHQVSSALSGAIAIELSSDNHYDLILMDVGLGDMSGCQATQMIRESGLNRTTPIVALTAHQDQEMREQCLSSGMDDYIVKPITEEILQEMLQALIKGEKIT